ncbi:hypothetical protein [Actinoallomurus sp. CA-142502]|uniref:hypothetical protein n=1 Tax=Actinoallomurus sp. CA-142502 TaxID=3239885 RepID=UPI003D8F009E
MSWEIREGEELVRQEVHRRCGGQTQGGISTPRKSADILLFETKGGQQYGYRDGPRPDGSYAYTGEGKIGDQRFVRGNAALLRHKEDGKSLRLFQEVKGPLVRYVGEYAIDSERPFRFEDGPDLLLNMRRAIVFRLLPAGVLAATPEPTLTVKDVDLDAHKADTFLVNGAGSVTEAERRESKLVRRYADWLERRGHKVMQRTMKSAAHVAPLRSDLLDVTADELIEAKSSAARVYIRLAIGQILDYGRYARTKRRAILLPARPSEDMADLLKALGIACIYDRGKGEFERIEPAAECCVGCPVAAPE